MEEVPIRVTPSATIASRVSMSRTPPEAFTCIVSGIVARMSRTSGNVAPPPAKPVEVLTKSAPASSLARQAASFCASSSRAVSKMTFTRTPAAWPVSTTAAMSCLTASTSPPRNRPMLSTMSSSVAPSASAWRDSATFAAVEVVPCGKPMTVHTRVWCPSTACSASRTSEGRTHTDQISSCASSRQVCSTSCGVSSGLSSAWSMRSATSCAVRLVPGAMMCDMTTTLG